MSGHKRATSGNLGSLRPPSGRLSDGAAPKLVDLLNENRAIGGLSPAASLADTRVAGRPRPEGAAASGNQGVPINPAGRAPISTPSIAPLLPRTSGKVGNCGEVG